MTVEMNRQEDFQIAAARLIATLRGYHAACFTDMDREEARKLRAAHRRALDEYIERIELN